jgi:hypothetical protein
VIWLLVPGTLSPAADRSLLSEGAERVCQGLDHAAAGGWEVNEDRASHFVA